jgi:hypothetical protein
LNAGELKHRQTKPLERERNALVWDCPPSKGCQRRARFWKELKWFNRNAGFSAVKRTVFKGSLNDGLTGRLKVQIQFVFLKKPPLSRATIGKRCSGLAATPVRHI